MRLALTVALLAALVLPAQASAEAACAEQVYRVGIPGTAEPQDIAGTLCAPPGATTVQVLVPGGTYNRSYWEYGAPSFRRAMNDAGFATLVIDRLGSGASSHPVSVLVTGDAHADAVHQVIQAVRPRFARVILGGHSIGSMIPMLEARKYQDADALLLTGFSHMINLPNAALIFTNLRPAGGLDPGYLALRPGSRYASFHSPGPYVAAAVEYDERNADVSTVGELVSAFEVANPVLGLTSGIRAPVLVVMGERDPAFCGFPGVGPDCSSSAALLRTEGRYFPSSARVDAFVLGGAGHSLNFMPNSGDYYEVVRAWAGS
ncbi:alpha/beta fold hydrolase [Pseudonocardiaceae bacterium YIM PH 21723]|nr:alpha/beta fold hydrolase [Pseudonocardiaceae bacterium YIM PH 21723]